MKMFDSLSLGDHQRTVWIFGAGASHTPPYDTPLQKDALARFMTMSRPGNAGAQSSLVDLRGRLTELIQAVLPGASHDGVSLEELFSAYELQASHLRSTTKEVADAKEAVRTLQRALAISIQSYGRGDSSKWTPFQRNSTPAAYAELVERLFPLGALPEDLRRHVLATMNYDINLDRCLIHLREPAAGDVDLDYGFELANYRIPGSFARPRDRSVLLLRLHGSLNWLRCLACQAVFTTVKSQVDIDEREQCSRCMSQSLDRVLVHPSYIRSYSDPLLQTTWGRLQEELTTADRWVFVGYSFPDADVHLRDALRHALRTRRGNGWDTRVVWAGYRSGAGDTNWEAECRRYTAVFGESLHAWNATAGGFADFLKLMTA